MNEYLREILAEEQGLYFCSVDNRYVGCDGDCNKCPKSIEFEKMLEEYFKKESEQK